MGGRLGLGSLRGVLKVSYVFDFHAEVGVCFLVDVFVVPGSLSPRHFQRRNSCESMGLEWTAQRAVHCIMTFNARFLHFEIY